MINLSGQALNFDANGNLLSDGQRNYSWNAENRLVGITYPGQSGRQTAFAYDGLNRRTAITSTPAGGGNAIVTSYIWCGSKLCQARNANNLPTRDYYAEGEVVPGITAQSYYYGPDQIGSVRRAFSNASSAPAYSYDPYGNALQTSAPLTDLNYAGMFYNVESGLYLTQYRAFDPGGGRWLSRDNAMCQANARMNSTNDDFPPAMKSCGESFAFCMYKADTGNISKLADYVEFLNTGVVIFKPDQPPQFVRYPNATYPKVN